MENINVIEILIYIINFVVTFALLYMLLYKPVSKFLAARKERVTATLKEAEERQTESWGILSAAKAELAGAAEKSRQLSHEAFETAALDADRILMEAEDEAQAIRERVRQQMKDERQAALERAYTELLSLTREMSSRVLSREVTLEDNSQIVEAFFKEVTGKNPPGKATSDPKGEEISP